MSVIDESGLTGYGAVERQVDSLVILSEVRREIVKNFTDELDCNEKWKEIHIAEGHPSAAERREEHCVKLRRWLTWLQFAETELLRAEELRLWKRAEHVSGFSQDQRPRLYAGFDAQYPPFAKG